MWQKVNRFKFMGLVLLVAAGLLTWQFTRHRPGGRVQEGDYLIYKIGGALFMYTPYTNEHRPLLEGWSINSFTLKNEWLAVSSNNNIYLLDYPFTNTPHQITTEQFDRAYLGSWSSDVQYLAYETVHQDMITVWLWDNTQQQTNAIYLYPRKDAFGGISWGPQGQFAFTRRFQGFKSGKGDADVEIFIWDGQYILNLSQDATSNDRDPVWSQDGRLAFLSESRQEVFVWDGVSKKNGSPDKSSFINVAPHLTDYASRPDWNHWGRLTFHGKASEIYQWDGYTTINLSNNPDYNNGGASWSKDGYWAFVTFFSKDQLVYVRNPANKTVFSAEGQYPPAWSEHGLLAFCTHNPSKRRLEIANLGDFLARLWAGQTLYQAYFMASTPIPSPSWRLSMWVGGQTAVQIIEDDVIDVRWSNGQYIHCSSG